MVRGAGRAARGVAKLPSAARVVAVFAIVVIVWASVNAVYQLMRKPAELWFPVSGELAKTPSETWREYGPLFRAYATDTMTPDLLAALAQVEGSGNPLARTYWSWQFSWNPLAWYRPASSAVGMYQMTDGNFDQARRFCIHDHVVASVTRWDDVHGCWFNELYTRVVPGDAIEMTSAFLDHEVAGVLAREHLSGATLRHRQRLAAVVHLCGTSGGEEYARRGFVAAGQSCGDVPVAGYVDDVVSLQRQFLVMAQKR